MTIYTNTGGVGYATGQSSFDIVLLHWLRAIMPEALNNEVPLWGLLSGRPNEPVGGKSFAWTVHVSGNEGHSAIKPGGKMPDAKRQGYLMFSSWIRHLYFSAQIDGVTVDANALDGSGFTDIADAEARGIINDGVREYNRIMQNNGTGILGQINGGAQTVLLASGNITISINETIEAPTTCSTAPTSNWFFRPGMRVAIVTPTGVIVGTALVNSITSSTQLNLTALSVGAGGAAANFAVADNDWIVRAAIDLTPATSSTAYRAEPQGIQGILSDALVPDGVGLTANQGGVDVDTTAAGVSFQGIAVSGNAFNQAPVLDNAGGGVRPITQDLLQAAVSTAMERNSARIQYLYSDYPQYNNFVSTLIPNVRFQNTGQLTTLKGGHEMADFNGIPWIRDRMAYANRVAGLALDTGDWRLAEMAAMHGVNGEGWMPVPGEDARYMILTHRWQMFVSDIRERAGFNLVDLAS